MHPKAVRIGFLMVFLASAISSIAQSQSKSLKVKIQYEDPIRNRHYPELLYWFVAPRTLNSHHYAQDIRHISRDTAFDFPFLTAREGVDFLNNPAAHAAVADIVKTTHENGLRIGMTLLGFPALGTAR